MEQKNGRSGQAVIGESIITTLMKARNKAITEKVRANTVVIDREFARVKGFYFADMDGMPMEFPEMIAGMKVLFDDLPDKDAAFYMLRAENPPESRTEKLERENRELREKLEGVRRLIARYDGE